MLSKQIPGNIVKALGGKGRRKQKILSKEVVFTKADESSSVLAPEITSDLESDCDYQKPLLPLPKLIGATPSGTSETLISLSDLTLNMADLTLDTPVPKKTGPSVKVSSVYVIKKKTVKSPDVPKLCSDKKADSSTEQLLLTLMEEVKGLKRQTKILSSTPPLSSQPSGSKATKQKTWFRPCKHCGFRNHLSDDCYSKPKCSTCGSTDHLTKEHLEHAAVKKTLSKLKAQSPLKPSPKKAPIIPKLFKECKYCRFNDHHSNHCEFYPRCEVCGSIAHEPSDCPKKHPRRPRIANRQSEPTENGCSRHMTWIKQYMHIYSKESSPKVVFGDDSSGDTEGYSLVNCNGITFTRVTYVNGLKHNLINISQLCDVNYKVLFTKTQGTIYNQNDKVVLIAPRRRDVYVIDIKMENLNKVRVKELRSDNGTEFRNHKLEEFYDEKEEDLLISAISMYLGVLFIFTITRTIWENLMKKLMMDSFLATLHEDDEAISQSSTEGDAINFNENRSFPNDEFLEPRSEVTQCPGNTEYFLYIPALFLAFDVLHGFYGVSDGCKECLLEWENLKGGYDLADYASMKCPMLPPKNLGPDESGVSVNETLFRGMIGSLMYYDLAVDMISNSPHVSVLGGCQILRGKLVCWSAKKQSSVAMSLAEAEYVAAAGCYAQVLWIKSQLADFDALYDKVPIFCNNTSAIAISNNLVLHSRTKHIDIRYAKDPTEIHGIKRRQDKGLQAFMDRFKSKSSHIKRVHPVLRISAFMHGHGHLKLAKKLNDKIPKTVDEMFERVRVFIRGEVVAGLLEMVRPS
ncbi:hypothetical protein Tco_0859041 [Tanacetum coccineum]|uniref:Retrovirus-related Pol polyprotein from transposon TNT 1-94-like beta-barrel domain-containing protein n=1 Tax=Tanacetum coccineum TaxID=301880 RepID=A0ABQ5BET4_9ASTR